MSSAILYLAIVAIWACVLVPRWLHRSHDNHSEQEEFAEGADPDQLVAAGEDGGDPVAWEDPDVVPAGPVPAEETTVHAEYSSVSYSMTTLSVETVGTADDLGGAADADGGAGGGAYVGPSVYGGPSGYEDASGYEAASANGGPPGYEGEPGYEGASGYDGVPTYADPGADYYAAAEPGPAPQHWSAVHTGPGRQQPNGPSRPPGRPPSRAHVLQARRRLLTMLVALTIGTATCTVAGVMPWWVLIVPIGLVGLYLLLLREVAQADAENTRRRAEAHAASVRAAHARAVRERQREAQAVPAPPPTAEVIDISALAAQDRDQLYDQYTDAEIRAVGD